MEERLAPGHNFLVYIGPLSISFSKISGISNELSVETINVGGINDRMVALYTQKKTTGTLLFEHGIGMIHPMNISFQAASLGIYLKTPGVIVCFQERKIKRIYGYSEVVPIRWSISDFNANDSSILIDTIEVMHHGIKEIAL